MGIITQSDLFRVLIALTGIGTKGMQFAFRAEDRSGSIREIADVIRKYGGRTVSILSSYENAPEGYRNVYIRFYDINRQDLDKLRDEHFYNLERADIVLRFFQEKSTFFRKEIESISQIDYTRDLILVAVVGEFGFGKVVAVGECLLEPKGNRAEVAFSVSSAYQGKGLGRALIRKLAEAARKNKISGLVSYTARRNKRMIHLFKSLPYQVKTAFDDDMLVLSCHLDEPEMDSRKDG